MCLFALFFGTIGYYRALEPGLFASAQASLHRTLGLINTVLLLSSSLAVAVAVHRTRLRRRSAPALFAAAAVCGIAFIVIKAAEYTSAIAAGAGTAPNDFFMLYFAFTGIHLVHVALGVVVLGTLAVTTRGASPPPMALVETGGLFWHLVDLLWIVLFTLFYLVP